MVCIWPACIKTATAKTCAELHATWVTQPLLHVGDRACIRFSTACQRLEQNTLTAKWRVMCNSTALTRHVFVQILQAWHLLGQQKTLPVNQELKRGEARRTDALRSSAAAAAEPRSGTVSQSWSQSTMKLDCVESDRTIIRRTYASHVASSSFRRLHNISDDL